MVIAATVCWWLTFKRTRAGLTSAFPVPQFSLLNSQNAPQGVGAFGKVFLVRHEPTGKAFALKEMLKKRLIMCKQHNNVVSERRVLQQVSTPPSHCEGYAHARHF